MRKYASRAEYKAEEELTIVRAVIGFYQEQRKKVGIHPARATWRELRFSFPRYAAESLQKVTADDLWKKLSQMIRCGEVKMYDTIGPPTYELVKGWRSRLDD